MIWRTSVGRLCPRGQTAKSDSVGKGARRSVPTPRSARCAFAHPTRIAIHRNPGWLRRAVLGAFGAWNSAIQQPEDSVSVVQIGNEPFADQVAQRFGRAAAERSVAGAAVKARYGELVCKAVSAVDLDRLARDPDRHVVAEHLGGGGEQGVREGIGANASAIEKRAARLDILVHVGELPPQALKAADRTTECGAIAQVAHRFVEGAFRHAQRYARIEATLRVESRQ